MLQGRRSDCKERYRRRDLPCSGLAVLVFFNNKQIMPAKGTTAISIRPGVNNYIPGLIDFAVVPFASMFCFLCSLANHLMELQLLLDNSSCYFFLFLLIFQLQSHTIFHILVFIGCLMTYDSMHTMALTRYLKNLHGLTSCNTIMIVSDSSASVREEL